jgi:hypothetical protein
MKPFKPKEYKRYIADFNLHRKDCVRLVFPSGAKIRDKSGLTGDYADGEVSGRLSSTESNVAHACPREFRSPDSSRSTNCLRLAVWLGE